MTEWHDAEEKKPFAYQLVWIDETFYGHVDMGYWDGIAWCMWGGSDDCHVEHWAFIDRPDTTPDRKERSDED